MRIAALLVATFALAGCAAGSRTVTTTATVTTTVERPQPKAPPGQQDATYFGSVVSVEQMDAKRYLLVVRPEYFLVGVTANAVFAAQQGRVCQPLTCPGVPDDRLVVPTGNKNLVFVLPAQTKGTVLTLTQTNDVRNVTVSAAQLAALVAGAKKPKLVEPLGFSGLWLRVDVDRVTAFAQQYQP